MATKGAPEVLLARCVDVPDQAGQVVERLFSEGARVVAVATKPAQGLTEPRLEDEHDLRLEGCLTFSDLPKADAEPPSPKLHALGIQVKIITGDNGTVAAKVCRDIGLEVEQVLTGAELERLDDDALSAAILHVTVFARVSPDEQSRIITDRPPRCAGT